MRLRFFFHFMSTVLKNCIVWPTLLANVLFFLATNFFEQIFIYWPKFYFLANILIFAQHFIF